MFSETGLFTLCMFKTGLRCRGSSPSSLTAVWSGHTLLTMTVVDTLSAHTGDTLAYLLYTNTGMCLPILAFLNTVHVDDSHQTSASSLH